LDAITQRAVVLTVASQQRQRAKTSGKPSKKKTTVSNKAAVATRTILEIAVGFFNLFNR
jgi:hypothetical protein